VAHERRDSIAHFTSSLVGECYGEYLGRRHSAFGYQLRDTHGEHASFAGPGASQNQQRSFEVRHSLALRGVE
jgi:hypothetical protein